MIMQYQIFLIPFYVIYGLSTHIDRNNSDVIITYEGHNEALQGYKGKSDAEKPLQNQEDLHNIDTVTKEYVITESYTEENDVVFIPNEKEVVRNEEYRDFKVNDLMEKTNIHNVMKEVDKNTEQPNKDIIFISGKNNENVENLEPKRKETPKHQNARTVDRKIIRLDCKNLDCNNTMHSICGGKEEEKKWKYRLFLNECYFRKVNCAFKYASNRYKEVSMENCKNMGGRVLPKPFIYQPLSYHEIKKNDTRRSFASRRTLNMGVDGKLCSHTCPEHCTEDYDPQCAISAAGQRRVFMNHCKLDYNSCLHGSVWQRRPLSECVGGKKADMRQNRGFIGWLQRVGIVDKRGRLVLS